MNNATWIWPNSTAAYNEYAEFYGEFNYDHGKTICNISCDGDYVLYVNGKYVSSNQYRDFEHYKIYDSIDLGSFLTKGLNRFAVLVWHFGKPTHRNVNAKPGLCFEVENTFDGKTVTLLKSCEAIKSRLSKAYVSHHEKQISKQLGYSFIYDSTKEDDWINGRGYDFNSSTVIDKKCEFFPRPVKKLEIDRRKRAEIIDLDPSGRIVIDLGEETVGLPELEFHSPCDQEIIVKYGEYLKDGRVKDKLENHSDFSFTYIAKEGYNHYINYMLKLGCRYLEIECKSPIKVEYIGILPHYYPVEELPYDFGSKEDNDIYSLCLRTLRLCMMEHYYDCPWREQGLYSFDARNQMLCGYYAFKGGNYDYARANLLLMSKDRRSDGLLSITFPCGTPFTIPGYSLYFIIAVKEYVEHSRDVEAAREMYDKMRSLFKVFLANMENGLICSFEGRDKWNFYDWTPYMKNTNGTSQKKPDLMINCLMIKALNDFKWLCEAGGMEFDYQEELQSIAAAAKKAFYHTEDGLFALTAEDNLYTVLGNSFAILSGLATKEEAEFIAEKMANDELLPCTLSMKTFMYDALLAVDSTKYSEWVLNMIRSDYGYMLSQGATAAWETIEGPDALSGTGSLCHGWSAIPVYYYHRLKKNLLK